MVSRRRQRRARSPWPRGAPRPCPCSSSPRAPSPNARTRTDAAEVVPTPSAETEVSAARPERFRPGLSAPSTIQTPTPTERPFDDDITRDTREFLRVVIRSSPICRSYSSRRRVIRRGRTGASSLVWKTHASNPQLSLQPSTNERPFGSRKVPGTPSPRCARWPRQRSADPVRVPVRPRRS
jgi:hypothetical protein